MGRLKKSGHLLNVGVMYDESRNVPDIERKGVHRVEVRFRDYDDEGNPVNGEKYGPVLEITEDNGAIVTYGKERKRVSWTGLCAHILNNGTDVED